MRIYDEGAYAWNRCVGPNGNLGRVDPDILSELLDNHGIPWFTTAWPYSSGLKAYCKDQDLWKSLCNQAKI